MGNIIITPFLHKVLAFENNGQLEANAICTDGHNSGDILMVCPTLFLLGFGATTTNYSLSTIFSFTISNQLHIGWV
jgi:hypothetical protein